MVSARSFTLLAPMSAPRTSGQRGLQVKVTKRVGLAEDLHRGERSRRSLGDPVCDAGRVTCRPRAPVDSSVPLRWPSSSRTYSTRPLSCTARSSICLFL